MSDLFEELKRWLKDHPPLDFSQDQLLIRLPVKSNPNLILLPLMMALILFDPIREIP